VSQGYVYLQSPGHPKANKKGYVKRAVLIAEKYLGKYLTDNEVVHHKDFNRDNDNPTNLLLMDRSAHARFHAKINFKKRKAERRLP
jgi:hypothetical protein